MARASIFFISLWVCADALVQKAASKYGEDKSASEEREFQPAPPEGWEKAHQTPEWWVPAGSGAPPKGSKIALAFRGQYRRFTAEGYNHLAAGACSDWWFNKWNIISSIEEPLKASGSDVRYYFHSFSDNECPAYDNELVKDMKPQKYRFDSYAFLESLSKRQLTYTFGEVMKLVVEDGWASHAVVLRFDVQYNAPITAWNLDWSKANYPFRERRGYGSDLINIVPESLFQPYQQCLSEEKNPNHVADWFTDNHCSDGSCIHAVQGGNTHDTHGIGAIDCSFHSFLGIVRNCSAEYHKCP